MSPTKKESSDTVSPERGKSPASGSQKIISDHLAFGSEPTNAGGEITADALLLAPGAEEDLFQLTPSGKGWEIAAAMVSRFRPVPRLLWPMINNVFGRAKEIGRPDPIIFATISPLIHRASQDKILFPAGAGKTALTLAEAVGALKPDVVAAICFCHAICRRVSAILADRVYRPILDDALLRARIGFHVGQYSSIAGSGRGMLAGFAGRCGLVIQLALGDVHQTQRALTTMASGGNMSEVCSRVFGCDPLEVAALALISAGCSREIALGIASFSAKTPTTLEPTSDRYRWLVLFSIIENLRLGTIDELPEEYWAELQIASSAKDELLHVVEQTQRRGHNWSWLTQAQL